MEELLILCKKASRIFIYGAGKNAELLYNWFQEQGVDFSGFLVTSMESNPEKLHEKEVIKFDAWENKPDDLIISSMFPKTRGYFQVFELLEGRGISNAYFISTDEFNKLKSKPEEPDEIMRHEFFDHAPYSYEEGAPSEQYHYIFSQRQENEEGYRWRLSRFYLNKSEGRVISDFFKEATALEEFQSVYGAYHPLKAVTEGSEEQGSSCKIYMAAGASDAWALAGNLEPWIEPIQVGAALTDKRLFSVQDDTGDNVSARNRNWSEGTAIYWMWKNAPHSDYIGLCHYRRRLALTEDILKGLAPAGVDMVVTSPTFVFDNAGAFLELHTPRTDFMQLGKMIGRLAPEYSEAYERFLKARFYPPCNLFLMRWDVFREYGDMAFPVCLAIDEHYDSLRYRRKDRYMGYLLEVLLGAFIIRNKDRLKVAYTDMEYIRKE